MRPTCKGGYKFKDGKCKRVKHKSIGSSKSRKKKSRNPFKMLGSYIGLVAYPLLLFINMNNSFASILIKPIYIFKLPMNFLVNLSGCSDWGCIGIAVIIALVFTALLGFLMGWGIHLLIRRFKNENKK